MELKNRYWFAAIALFIVPMSGVGVDIYTPSLPAVSHFFHADKAWAQLSITVYMLGLGLMQLFAGSFSDSFGRKKPFFAAMIVFLLATLLIPQSHNIYALLFLRLLQGLMAAIAIVPMRAVLSDLFQGHEFKKMISYMTMAWSIGPIVAPAIGGHLQHAFGWQACFYFLAGYSLVGLLLVYFYLPETCAARHPFHLTVILKRYREILTHREFVICIFLNGIVYGLILLFAMVAPFLIQQVLHYSAVEFGQVALLAGLAWFLGAMTNRFLIHVDFVKTTKSCFWLMLLISTISLVATWHLPVSILLIMIPVLLLLWIGGIQFPNNFAHAVGLFPRIAGSANALFGGFVYLLSGACSLLGAGLKSSTSLPLMMVYTCFILVCLLLAYALGKQEK